MKTERECSHKITFKTRCIECELIMAREAVTHARDSFNQYSKLVVKLEAEQKAKDRL
jgi:hypothetical protein